MHGQYGLGFRDEGLGYFVARILQSSRSVLLGPWNTDLTQEDTGLLRGALFGKIERPLQPQTFIKLQTVTYWGLEGTHYIG